MLSNIIKFFLENKVITFILLIIIIMAGIYTSPFSNKNGFFPADPVSVDAIPDIGENQQIVFTGWKGRSPKDIDDQVTYPLTSSLLGISGIKTIRSSSMFGFSSIYIIFEDDVDYYWSRTRILEKLNSLPLKTLPEGVKPTLGPDATALGQIFWYTIEGRDKDNNVTSGWDLHEIRTVQDYYVKYALLSAGGVAEVASIGGYVKEYQIDLNPSALKAANISLNQIIKAVKESNIDVGAGTIEINNAEYFVRGIGYIKNISDIENIVIKSVSGSPIYLKSLANISYGPANRRGVLDKMGAEVAGGVVVARYGENPLEVINNVKEKITEIAPGMPEKIVEDSIVSKLTIVPFYDRTKLIKETLGTLEDALNLEIMVTVIVVLVMVMNLRASMLVSFLIPLAVLMTFSAMKMFNIEANIVALSGIAIAIGTIVDVGIVFSENMIRHTDNNKTGAANIYNAVIEVLPSVLTAILTTIISFIPVFMMEASEGKLFRPLAYTKTFVLAASIIVAVLILPALGHLFFKFNMGKKKYYYITNILLTIAAVVLFIDKNIVLGLMLTGLITINFLEHKFKELAKFNKYIMTGFLSFCIVYLLSDEWLVLGATGSFTKNFIFIAGVIGLILTLFILFKTFYEKILKWCLNNKLLFLSLPFTLVVWASLIWLGFAKVTSPVTSIWNNFSETEIYSSLNKTFPGIGKEFMPSLDEGSFLLMPTSMPHSGIEENKRVLRILDLAASQIDEVENVVGKLGRAESSLDPAPISMYENVINYKTEYITDENGRKIKFRTDSEGNFVKDENGNLIPDKNGKYFRQWRDKIKSADDIWNEIVEKTKLPGVTSAPKLQPIETRLVMLSTGMRAPIGIKVSGDNLEKIEKFGLELEELLKNVEGVKDPTVFAERIVGKPYLEIIPDRTKLSRYSISIESFNKHIEVLLGGISLNTIIKGRERYPLRVRYPRDQRSDPYSIGNVLISGKSGHIPLKEVAEIKYIQGPQVIKSENTFPVSYVIFDREKEFSEIQVVENAEKYLSEKIKNRELIVPDGISFDFTGNYENQVRAEKRLSILLPLVLLIIFTIIYFQFKKLSSTLTIFTGIAVAFSGGFILIWLYGQPWFLNFELFGLNLRNLFHLEPLFLSVAVWVGFIALFGIATDDGVLISSYIKKIIETEKPETKDQVREAVIKAGKRRIRACLMTTATTILALLPVLSSTGRGSDIMIPMAIPLFGGMIIELITLFVVPVIYSYTEERKL